MAFNFIESIKSTHSMFLFKPQLCKKKCYTICVLSNTVPHTEFNLSDWKV